MDATTMAASTTTPGASRQTPSTEVKATRASAARERASAALLREAQAAASNVDKKKRAVIIDANALRVTTERLHKGERRTPKTTRGGEDETCTFAPKIGAASLRLASKYREKHGDPLWKHGSSSVVEALVLSKVKTNVDTRGADFSGGNGASPKETSVGKTTMTTTTRRPIGKLPPPQKEKVVQTSRELEELKELEACTFAPKISRRSAKISENLLKKADMPTSFLGRSKLWAERKEHVLEAEREAKRNEEVRGCTFQPELLAAPLATMTKLTLASTSQMTMTTLATTTMSTPPPATTKSKSKSSSEHSLSPLSSMKTPKSAVDTANPGILVSSSAPPTTPGLQAYLARQESARKLREEKEAILNRCSGESWKPRVTVPVEFAFTTRKSSATTTTTTSTTTTADEPKQRENAAAAENAPRDERPPPIAKSPAYVAARTKLLYRVGSDVNVTTTGGRPPSRRVPASSSS
jgi:hypothetical protein